MATHFKMGFEGQIKYGVAGSAATVLLENTGDITYTLSHERGDSTVRGDSSGPPIQTSSVTARIAGVEFQMKNYPSDASLEAMRVACAAGTPVAIKCRDHATGKGFDGDVNVEVSSPYPLGGEQVVSITCTPTRDGGRMPQLYVV